MHLCIQIRSTGHRYQNFMTRFSSWWVHFVPFLHVARAEICSSDTLTQCVNSVYLTRTVWKSACFLRRREESDISLNELHSQCNWKKSDGGPVVCLLAAMEISLACVDITDWPTLKKEVEEKNSRQDCFLTSTPFPGMVRRWNDNFVSSLSNVCKISHWASSALP